MRLRVHATSMGTAGLPAPEVRAISAGPRWHAHDKVAATPPGVPSATTVAERFGAVMQPLKLLSDESRATLQKVLLSGDDADSSQSALKLHQPDSAYDMSAMKAIITALRQEISEDPVVFHTLPIDPLADILNGPSKPVWTVLEECEMPQVPEPDVTAEIQHVRAASEVAAPEGCDHHEQLTHSHLPGALAAMRCLLQETLRITSEAAAAAPAPACTAAGDETLLATYAASSALNITVSSEPSIPSTLDDIQPVDMPIGGCWEYNGDGDGERLSSAEGVAAAAEDVGAVSMPQAVLLPVLQQDGLLSLLSTAERAEAEAAYMQLLHSGTEVDSAQALASWYRLPPLLAITPLELQQLRGLSSSLFLRPHLSPSELAEALAMLAGCCVDISGTASNGSSSTAQLRNTSAAERDDNISSANAHDDVLQSVIEVDMPLAGEAVDLQRQYVSVFDAAALSADVREPAAALPPLQLVPQPAMDVTSAYHHCNTEWCALTDPLYQQRDFRPVHLPETPSLPPAAAAVTADVSCPAWEAANGTASKDNWDAMMEGIALAATAATAANAVKYATDATPLADSDAVALAHTLHKRSMGQTVEAAVVVGTMIDDAKKQAQVAATAAAERAAAAAAAAPAVPAEQSEAMTDAVSSASAHDPVKDAVPAATIAAVSTDVNDNKAAVPVETMRAPATASSEPQVAATDRWMAVAESVAGPLVTLLRDHENSSPWLRAAAATAAADGAVSSTVLQRLDPDALRKLTDKLGKEKKATTQAADAAKHQSERKRAKAQAEAEAACEAHAAAIVLHTLSWLTLKDTNEARQAYIERVLTAPGYIRSLRHHIDDLRKVLAALQQNGPPSPAALSTAAVVQSAPAATAHVVLPAAAAPGTPVAVVRTPPRTSPNAMEADRAPVQAETEVEVVSVVTPVPLQEAAPAEVAIASPVAPTRSTQTRLPVPEHPPVVPAAWEGALFTTTAIPAPVPALPPARAPRQLNFDVRAQPSPALGEDDYMADATAAYEAETQLQTGMVDSISTAPVDSSVAVTDVAGVLALIPQMPMRVAMSEHGTQNGALLEALTQREQLVLVERACGNPISILPDCITAISIVPLRDMLAAPVQQGQNKAMRAWVHQLAAEAPRYATIHMVVDCSGCSGLSAVAAARAGAALPADGTLALSAAASDLLRQLLMSIVNFPLPVIWHYATQPTELAHIVREVVNGCAVQAVQQAVSRSGAGVMEDATEAAFAALQDFTNKPWLADEEAGASRRERFLSRLPHMNPLAAAAVLHAFSGSLRSFVAASLLDKVAALQALLPVSLITSLHSFFCTQHSVSVPLPEPAAPPPPAPPATTVSDSAPPAYYTEQPQMEANAGGHAGSGMYGQQSWQPSDAAAAAAAAAAAGPPLPTRYMPPPRGSYAPPLYPPQQQQAGSYVQDAREYYGSDARSWPMLPRVQQPVGWGGDSYAGSVPGHGGPAFPPRQHMNGDVAAQRYEMQQRTYAPPPAPAHIPEYRQSYPAGYPVPVSMAAPQAGAPGGYWPAAAPIPQPWPPTAQARGPAAYPTAASYAPMSYARPHGGDGSWPTHASASSMHAGWPAPY